jgi:phospholipid transport system transporter-binding protein
MNQAGLRIEQHDGRLSLSGELDHAGVAQALAAGRNWLSRGSGLLQVDLSGISRSESAGAALLLEWLRQARRLDREIEFLNPPAQLRSLLKFFELESLLPVRT